ncbi:hypothetical protein SAMN04487821_14613 [Enterococcus malodoratus]|uniref:hypothetical protein n=1 Tax=Enterococcus malodoratus TaxID=71451 RepID=UPI0008C15E79|nr:hypothetical protein [Enterococcus malodoratus]SEU00861.1 hypothetical protein SAMN04487821_14613 [Enterococcus malodoratus]
MDKSGVVKLKIHLEGKAFDPKEGYNLFYLSESLSNFQNLVEKTYLYTENKTQMSSVDRENLEVKLTNIEEGSFLSDAFICIRDMTLPLVPLIAETKPEMIWELIKQSYSYIKTTLKARKKGEVTKVEMNDSTGSLQVVDNHGDIIINNINPAVIEVAAKTSPIYYRMAHLVTDDDRVEKITLGEDDSSDESISLGIKEKELFKRTTYLSDDVITISGVMTRANGDSLTGRLEVDEAENLEAGQYQVEFLEKDDAPKILKDSLFAKRTFTCMVRYSFDPITLTDNVIGLKIIKMKS